MYEKSQASSSVRKWATARISPRIKQVKEHSWVPPMQRVNAPKNLLLKPRVILDQVVKCPGCSIFLENQEKCAQHLLQECLFAKHSVKKEFTQWILRYFYIRYAKSKPNEKLNSKDRQKAVKRKRVKISNVTLNIPVISFDLQCPVCDKYFYPAEVCYKHLFGNCLRTKKLKKANLIRNWFSKYLQSNCQSKLDYMVQRNQFENVRRRVVCNYCKKEFFDKKTLLNHFSSTHRQEIIAGDPICTFCNFKPGSYNQLFRHLIRWHVKCGCMEKQKDFITLRMHLTTCPKRDDCMCPICQEVKVESFVKEEDFKTHMFNCPRPAPLKLNLRDLYIQCDICFQEILKCNLDIHVAKHMEYMKAAKRRPRSTVVRFNNNLSDSDCRKKK